MSENKRVHELVLDLLVEQGSATPDEINQVIGDGNNYASKYIHTLKKMGYEIAVTKAGRNVVAYEYVGPGTSEMFWSEQKIKDDARNKKRAEKEAAKAEKLAEKEAKALAKAEAKAEKEAEKLAKKEAREKERARVKAEKEAAKRAREEAEDEEDEEVVKSKSRNDEDENVSEASYAVSSEFDEYEGDVRDLIS